MAATVANVNRGKGKKPAVPADFLPEWDRRPKSPQELWQKVLQANAALGGEVRTTT